MSRDELESAGVSESTTAGEMLMHLHHVARVWRDPEPSARCVIRNLQPFGHTTDASDVRLDNTQGIGRNHVRERVVL